MVKIQNHRALNKSVQLEQIRPTYALMPVVCSEATVTLAEISSLSVDAL